MSYHTINHLYEKTLSDHTINNLSEEMLYRFRMPGRTSHMRGRCTVCIIVNAGHTSSLLCLFCLGALLQTKKTDVSKRHRNAKKILKTTK